MEFGDDGGPLAADLPPGLRVDAFSLVHEQAIIGDYTADPGLGQAGCFGYGSGAVICCEGDDLVKGVDLIWIDDEAALPFVVFVRHGRVSGEVFPGAEGFCSAFFHACLQDFHFDAGKPAFHEQEHPVAVLGRVEDAAHGGEFDLILAAQVQPGGVVLHGVVAGQPGQFYSEDDVDFSGPDVGFEAAALL